MTGVPSHYHNTNKFYIAPKVDLTCKQGSGLTTPRLVSADPCNYFIDWAMSEACPAHQVEGSNCTVSDGVTGMMWTLDGLRGRELTVPLEGCVL